MIAAKHFDPQLGIDIHSYLTPASAFPTPHIGIVLDPFDYIPFIGGTVKVNGVHKATAGTGGLCIHIPVSGLWAPEKPAPGAPQAGDDIFLGSMTVLADNEPFSRLAMLVLDCNLVGMVPPFRLSKPEEPVQSLTLPTAVNLAVPTNVIVGGPPTISKTALAAKAAFGILGKLRKAKPIVNKLEQFAQWRKDHWGSIKWNFLRCNILRAEPVDIRDGSVSVTHEDFSIPGRLPLVWERQYSSRDHEFKGACGHGWQTPADLRLEVEANGMVSLQGPGAMALFLSLPRDEQEQVLDAVDGARMQRQNHELVVRFKDGLRYCFDDALAVGVAVLPHARTLPIVRIEDASGNHWRFERTDGKLLRIVESGIEGAQGRFIEVESDDQHLRALTLHDPATGTNHVLVRYRHAEGNLTAALDPLGAARTFEYVQHHLVAHTDRTGLTFRYAYNAQAQVVRAWGDGGWYDYHFAYDDVLRQTEVTDSLGHLSVIKFDAYGLPIAEIDPLDGVTRFEYDDFARTVGVTDPEGLRTGFDYDERGNLLRVVQPDGSVVSHEYDADDRLIAVVGPMGERWAQTTDAYGRPATEIDPLGAITRYEHDAHGQLVRHIDPRGAVTALAYDRRGQLSAITDPLGYDSRFEHDALGRLQTQANALGQGTRYHYDAKGRLLRIDQPDGTQIACEYDAEDQLVRYVDETGAQTRLEYVGIGQIAKRVQPDGRAVQYHYDTEEQLIGVTNQRGERYELRRDALGRIVEEVDYWGQARRYEYDAAGRLLSTMDPLGLRIAYTADKLGRITRKTLPDVLQPGQQIHEHFVYDQGGRLVELRNPARQVKRRFDPAGRLLEELQDGFRIAYEYDANGNCTLRETSAGNRVVCEFDLRGQVSRIAINDEAPIVIERDALGRTTQEQLGAQMQRRYAYDARSLLTAQTVLKDAQPVFETRYDYDRAGNLTRRRDSQQGTDQYSYDVLGRLLEHIDPKGQIERFVNDAAGDRLQTRVKQVQLKQAVGAEGGQDQVHWTREGTYQGMHYVFDRAGDLVRKGNPNGPRPDDLELIWDANHRLAQSTKNGQTTHYGYDCVGRRVFKRNPTQTTWFFWDGDALLGEVKEPNAQAQARAHVSGGVVLNFQEARARAQRQKELHAGVREYIYYPGSFVPLARVERTDAATEDKTDTWNKREMNARALSRGAHSLVSSVPVDTLAPASAAKTAAPKIPSKSTVAPLSPSGLSALGGSASLGGGAGLGRKSSLDGCEAEELPTRAPVSGALGGISLGSMKSAIPVESKDLVDSPESRSAPLAAEARASDLAVVESPAGKFRVLYYHVDPNGCPTRITDDRGSALWSASFFAWGGIAVLRTQGVDNPIRYQGQYFDDETGLHFNRYRYYDTEIGGYVAHDPLRLSAGENTYAYGRNAIAWIDPFGLHATQIPYDDSNALVERAHEFRLSEGIRGGRNVAVFEYLDGNGDLAYETTASRGGRHAERKIANKIAQMGIDPSRVRQIYSELAPCPSIRGLQFCQKMLDSVFHEAKITYSFEYGEDRASRRQGIKSLKDAVSALFKSKCAGGGG